MPDADPTSLAQPAYSAAARAAIARAPALFIGNAWVASSHGRLIAVEDPSTGKTIAHVADASDADVDRAVAAARAAFDDGRWSGLGPAKRERIMHRLADLIETHADEFSELEAIDNGKPRSSAMAIDIPAAIDALRYMAGWASKIGGETPEPYALPPGEFFGYTLRQPVGVCAQIVPWNFPLLMAAQKIAPALAAGCTLVLKPAEQTPLTALRLADLVAEAGFPAGVVNIVTGMGETAGAALVRHPSVDKVAFTGSTAVGKAIGRNAIDTVKRLTLELGGKSPVIVFSDADIAGAARGASGAIFANAGQVCVAGSRLFAHRSVFDDVLERIAASTADWRPRPSLDPAARMGPLVSRAQLDRVAGYIEAGRRDGASVAVGGDSPASDGGYYLNPTVLVDVDARMRVAREEIFGPVLVAQRFDDLDEVAAAANDTAYGLGASVWTRDIATMHGMAARIRAGLVWGNTHGAIDTAFPFGGFKQSGIGREQGRQGIEAYLETKTVVVKI